MNKIKALFAKIKEKLSRKPKEEVSYNLLAGSEALTSCHCTTSGVEDSYAPCSEPLMSDIADDVVFGNRPDDWDSEKFVFNTPIEVKPKRKKSSKKKSKKKSKK